MGQLQNVQRGNLFLWFLATFFFTLFIIFRLVKNQMDFKQEGQQQVYRQGEPRKQPVNNSLQMFDSTVIRQDKPAQDDTILQRWIKKVHQYEVYYMPILFPFALNLMTGTTYTFVMVVFLVTLLTFIIFNLLKIHRKVIDNRVIRSLLENLSYVLSFLMLLNVWITKPTTMPYVVVQG